MRAGQAMGLDARGFPRMTHFVHGRHFSIRDRLFVCLSVAPVFLDMLASSQKLRFQFAWDSQWLCGCSPGLFLVASSRSLVVELELTNLDTGFGTQPKEELKTSTPWTPGQLQALHTQVQPPSDHKHAEPFKLRQACLGFMYSMQLYTVPSSTLPPRLRSCSNMQMAPFHKRLCFASFLRHPFEDYHHIAPQHTHSGVFTCAASMRGLSRFASCKLYAFDVLSLRRTMDPSTRQSRLMAASGTLCPVSCSHFASPKTLAEANHRGLVTLRCLPG